MLFDHIYHNRRLMITIPTGIKLKEIIALYDTQKQKILRVSRFLKKDGTSIWYIKTEIRKTNLFQKFINYLKEKLFKSRKSR